ncbi:MAG: HAMP domain-containing histidine kinase [Oscillospiraceae bacterium]|nr:HAMP domain-containing histidine kinase [Oscillospiraceae bacterium]
MLKKLRIKLVAVIMIVATVLLGTIFGCVMHLTRENLERESIRTMRSLVHVPPVPNQMPGQKPDQKPDQMPEKPKDDTADRRETERKERKDRQDRREVPEQFVVPYIHVTLDSDDGIAEISGNYYDLADEALIRQLTDAALADGRTDGRLSALGFRYLRADNGWGKSLVFTDLTSEQIMLSGLIRNCLLIGLVSWVTLLLISLLLAKWMTRPVETAWNMQKQFVADASHELKTPLTVIMTNAEMLTDGSYSCDEQSRFTENILSMSRRMRGLVESLLELARMDSGTAQRTHETLPYSKLIEDGMLPFEPLFYENGMGIVSEIEHGITVCGDRSRLMQVTEILLDNALKYSEPAGTVTVRLKQQGARCILSVSGNGAPLSKEDCKNIFKRFYRVDPARNDGRSYGLGLSIADSIVQEHGGRIWAESTGGCNTMFVSLPAKQNVLPAAR